MAEWKEMSVRAIRSAKLLKEESDLRGSVSRAYYAAYYAVMHALPEDLTFPGGRNNPPHDRVPRYIKNNLSLPKSKKKEVIKAFNTVKSARVTADYRPRLTVDQSLSISSVKSAQLILSTLA
jgi:uncharacterized protein (UPF0332 family)